MDGLTLYEPVKDNGLHQFSILVGLILIMHKKVSILGYRYIIIYPRTLINIYTHIGKQERPFCAGGIVEA